MKMLQIEILVLFVLLHIIHNEPIEIKSNGRVNFTNRITLEYDYKLSYPNIQEDIGAYFFFRFSYIGITVKIIDEDKKAETFQYTNSYKCYPYKIKNTKPQKYTFNISCINCGSVIMHFIDNSKEINVSLKQFSEIYVDSEKISNIPPLPLVFNLEESFEEKLLIVEMDMKYDESTIYEGKYKVEYCEINENECNFTHNEPRLILEKDKKYKIRFNCFEANDNTYYFIRYNISSIIKELGYGYYNFEITDKFRHIYYILNFSNYNDFYIHLNYSYPYKEYYSKKAFITEDEKKEFLKDRNTFNNFDYNEGPKSGLNEIQSKKDYLILYFRYSSDNIKIIIYLFPLLYDLQDAQIITMEKGEYGLIIKKTPEYKDNYIIASSSYNMKIFDSNFSKKTFTNLIILQNNDYYSSSDRKKK